ncbi:UDP-N-acetylmuramoylalanine/D-glutamate ligase [Prosthecochloris aestuarii DSM 271]|uniref:UDP-N-acetylmuramoylalanine--D-glutamate ligase n=1 Tax=Prosthecochloris aestuarii (strain DSM 271 / SK 413) TaxID=290512 RepID=B4S6R1_PROA2|nr:UDP-N-acetylmuramoyl-L-alanine--D-glutamate ligase [Prosthecochloris aestuarii]ACF47266.1 UDP-N-acetylmuramoylalanine/D-glutamate ligase [Prosthecochloris aestuarii DSM 271]
MHTAPLQIEGARVSVIGARRSGIAAALLMREQGASVFVSERGALVPGDRELLAEKGIDAEQGGHTGRVYDADFCIVSPGVPLTAPVMQFLRARDIAVYSEIEAASWFCPARIIAVTGTDGKTTTATLIAAICADHALAAGYRVFSVGNIGVPFSSMVGSMASGDIAVVEVSSYQLEGCTWFRPDIALMTNITPDHLDRYDGSMRLYAEAKYRIFSRQRQDDTLIVNADDPILRQRFEERLGVVPQLAAFGLDAGRTRAFAASGAVTEGGWITLFKSGSLDERVIAHEDLLKRGFMGRHNLSNALAAALAADAAGVPLSSIKRALKAFGGVEHRQEYVCEIDGVICINDSKATNLNAMRQALEAVSGPVVLIAGGRDKDGDYRELRDLVASKVEMLVALGEAADRFTGAYGESVPAVTAGSLREAVRLGLQHARRGSTLLFSPGCSSFDMFDNFEHRGAMFKSILRESTL